MGGGSSLGAPYPDSIACEMSPDPILLCPSLCVQPSLRAGHLCSSQASPFPLLLADYLQYSRAFFLISALAILIIIIWLSISLTKGPGDKTYIDLGISIFCFISGTAWWGWKSLFLESLYFFCFLCHFLFFYQVVPCLTWVLLQWEPGLFPMGGTLLRSFHSLQGYCL